MSVARARRSTTGCMRAGAGEVLLRIEDTDVARSPRSRRPRSSDMRWLGLEWDEGPDVGGPNGPTFNRTPRDLSRVRREARRDGPRVSVLLHAEEIESRRAARPSAATRRATTGAAARSRTRHARVPGRGRRTRSASRSKTAARPLGRSRARARRVPQRRARRLRRAALGRAPTLQLRVRRRRPVDGITEVIRGDDHISKLPRQLLLYAASAGSHHTSGTCRVLGSDAHAAVEAPWRDVGDAVPCRGLPARGADNFLALLAGRTTARPTVHARGAERQVPHRAGRGQSVVFNTEKLEGINAQHLKRLDPAERAPVVEY